MHLHRSVALDHDDAPRGLRDGEAERQRQCEAHCVLDVEILRGMTHGGPQIGRVAKGGDDEHIVGQAVCEHPVVVGPARLRAAHHWMSSRDSSSANGLDASSA